MLYQTTFQNLWNKVFDISGINPAQASYIQRIPGTYLAYDGNEKVAFQYASLRVPFVGASNSFAIQSSVLKSSV